MKEDTPVATASPPSRDAMVRALDDVRQRTLQLIAPLSDEALTDQHDPLMSPIVWDLGHIGAFEELWLVRRPGQVTSEAELDEVYDAFRTPRSARGNLALPAVRRVLDRMSEIRDRATEVLESIPFDADNPLLRDGFAWEMVRQHEAQHQETILQTIQLIASETYVPATRREAPPARDGRSDGTAPVSGRMIRVPGGSYEMGDPGTGFAYDNERPRRSVDVAAFEIGRHPVTNRAYVEFMAAGGYEDRTLWSDAGWAWAREAELAAPQFWELVGDRGTPSAADARAASRDAGVSAWRRRTSLGPEDLQPWAPVVHVCCHEAEACARFFGARLPTEAEWEKAAAWDPESGASRSWPWGAAAPTSERANFDQLGFGVDPVGSRPSGASAIGCEEMIGDVWEWTASDFSGYPGFRAFPYPEYSEVFFGPDYRVLRGGSWATRPAVARNTFRNWDYPIRRQIFSGFRLARDV